jgi:hypothetical protein
LLQEGESGPKPHTAYLIDLSRGDITVCCERHIQKPLVIAKIEISLRLTQECDPSTKIRKDKVIESITSRIQSLCAGKLGEDVLKQYKLISGQPLQKTQHETAKPKAQMMQAQTEKCDRQPPACLLQAWVQHRSLIHGTHFTTIIEHEDFSVLKGRHCPGISIQVGICKDALDNLGALDSLRNV